MISTETQPGVGSSSGFGACSDRPRSGNLGPAEIREMESAGWRFNDSGLRLGNCWAVWAEDPKGNLRIVFLADPEQEPEKFAAPQAPKPRDDAQLNLFECVSPNAAGSPTPEDAR